MPLQSLSFDYKLYCPHQLLARVAMKVGLFNARIQSENHCYTLRLIH